MPERCKHESGPSGEGMYFCDKFHWYDADFEPCTKEDMEECFEVLSDD